MKILAIETSCDETAIAIIERKTGRKFRVLANLVSSQTKIHEKFGGVVPNLARREHEKNLVPILIRALKEAGLYRIKNNESGILNQIKLQNSQFTIPYSILEREEVLRKKFLKYILPLKQPAIDMIAVTCGPGLAPALWTGVNFAKALSVLWHIPLCPINHMEGHIFSALIKSESVTYQASSIKKKTNDYSLASIRYPAIALLVSGGHTELHLIKKTGEYKRIGETLDDAAGEAFDKVAKMLGLGYPGGPEISKQAESGNPRAISFPRPMLKSNNFDFSFSGLKTAVLYYLRDNKIDSESLSLRKVSRSPSGHGSIRRQAERERGRESSGRASRWASETPSICETNLSDIAASFEQAVVDVLVEKTARAAQKYQAKTVLIGGGVAANKKLRAELGAKISGTLFLTPQITHTGDNALMIALAAAYSEHSRTAFSRWKKKTANFGAMPGLRL